MTKVMFVCHGNICRSPMAEFVLKNMVKKLGVQDKFCIASSATSTEAIGNPVHRGTREKLAEHGIFVKGKYAIQFTKKDYKEYDYIIAMDSYNIKNLMRIIGEDTQKKVCRLLDFDGGGDIADPWYTGDFDQTYDDIRRGLEAFINKIRKN